MNLEELASARASRELHAHCAPEHLNERTVGFEFRSDISDLFCPYNIRRNFDSDAKIYFHMPSEEKQIIVIEIL